MKNASIHDISKSTSGYESVGGGGAAGKRSNEEGSTTSLATSPGGPPQRKADLAVSYAENQCIKTIQRLERKCRPRIVFCCWMPK